MIVEHEDAEERWSMHLQTYREDDATGTGAVETESVVQMRGNIRNGAVLGFKQKPTTVQSFLLL